MRIKSLFVFALKLSVLAVVVLASGTYASAALVENPVGPSDVTSFQATGTPKFSEQGTLWDGRDIGRYDRCLVAGGSTMEDILGSNVRYGTYTYATLSQGVVGKLTSPKLTDQYIPPAVYWSMFMDAAPNGGTGPLTVQFDLGSIQTIAAMQVWNCNWEAWGLQFYKDGAATCDLQVSDNGTAWTTVVDNLDLHRLTASSTTYLGTTYAFSGTAQADIPDYLGGSVGGGGTFDDFSGTAVSGRYIRFADMNYTDNATDDPVVYLQAVRFYTPEPALLWDADTNTPGAQDGGGTWIHGGDHWWDGEGNVAWDNAWRTIATFGAGGTGAATVTVDATGVTAGGITFNEGATYTIDGGKITLEGDATVEANVDARIESVIDAGTAVLTKTGDGTLELTGANTYSGVAVDGGTLVGYAGVGDTGSILGDVALSAGTNVTFNQGSDGAYGGKITGDGSVTKTGAGMLEVTSCDHDYTGGLRIRAGTLQVTGWLPMDSMTTVEAGGTLGGTGLVAAIDLLRGGTVAPGASVGILQADGDVTLGAGAAYEWEVADLDGSAGTGWDLLDCLADLIVSATPGDPFTINVVSLDPFSGDPGAAGGTLEEGDSFQIVSAVGITGFSADAFTVDTSAFANPMGGLEFVVAERTGSLYLDVVPEPATMALMALGGVGLLLKRRRSK